MTVTLLPAQDQPEPDGLRRLRRREPWAFAVCGVVAVLSVLGGVLAHSSGMIVVAACVSVGRPDTARGVGSSRRPWAG
jgi:hypothetical protein